MNAISLNPKFGDLQNPETLIKHVQDLTKVRATPHAEILSKLLQQFEQIDFEAIANPHNAENFKLNNKHYTVLSIENVIQVAENNRWGLCKNHDFIYLYNSTYWNELDKGGFQKFLGEAAEKMGVPMFSARYYLFREQLYKQFLGTAYLEPKQPKANKVLINLQNGTFEITPKGTQLRPFDRSDFLTYQLPFEYNPNAKAPLFEAYLNKVLPDIERQKVLAEYLGFVFIKHGSNALKEEKALILYGTGANGKSVFFEIVTAMFGRENVSNFSLQSLTEEKGFYRAKIGNKLVNYASEINGKLETSLFKAMVSGEPVEACLKHGQPFTMSQYAKFIFNCNELPKDVEHTNAYFRRFLIIPFDVTIPPHEQDKQLHSKIIENELSGVFNWVLDGLNRLLEQKRFSDCDAAQRAVEQYKSTSDSVKMFVDENEYKPSPTDFKFIKDLYTAYRAFCIDDGFKPVNKSNFIKRLSGFGVLIKRLNVGNVAYLSDGKKTF
jgi:putative DNA primase/helicase